MRVLLVGLRQPGQVGGHCEQALRELDQTIRQLEVLDIAAHPLFVQRDSSNALISQAAGAIHTAWLNRALLGRARTFRPDVVLAIKGHELRPATLAAIRAETGARLGNWNTDNPFNRLNSSADLLAGIPQYDGYFIWGRYLLPELRRAGARRAEHLPFAYNPALHRPARGPRTETGRRARLVFAGSPDPARLPFLRQVSGLGLELWGNHWNRLPGDDPLRACWKGVAEGERLAPALWECEIALNFIREQNGSAHNMRTYEVPACGAFLLTSYTEEQTEILGEGSDAGAGYFESPDELRDKAEYYLRHPAECEAIACRGWERITHGANTYRDRMQTVLDVLSS